LRLRMRFGLRGFSLAVFNGGWEMCCCFLAVAAVVAVEAAAMATGKSNPRKSQHPTERNPDIHSFIAL